MLRMSFPPNTDYKRDCVNLPLSKLDKLKSKRVKVQTHRNIRPHSYSQTWSSGCSTTPQLFTDMELRLLNYPTAIHRHGAQAAQLLQRDHMLCNVSWNVINCYISVRKITSENAHIRWILKVIWNDVIQWARYQFLSVVCGSNSIAI